MGNVTLIKIRLHVNTYAQGFSKHVFPMPGNLHTTLDIRNSSTVTSQPFQATNWSSEEYINVRIK